MGLEDLTAALRSGAVPACHQPVFIIGSPRSGTTALARALAEHSGLWTSHESYVLHGLFGDGRPARVHHKQANRDAFGWVITEQVDRAEFLAYVGLGLNALFTSRAGGRRWIDQTPMYTLMVDDLAELFPDALFLHILRDGRGVVNSMMSFNQKFAERPEAARHVPSWATDVAEACRTWASYVTRADEFCLRNPARTLTVVNEALSADPVRGFDGVLGFLGLATEPGPASRFGGQRINSSFVRGTGRPDTWDSWPVGHREVFVAEAGAAMAEMGLADAAELQRWAQGVAAPDLRLRDGARR
jgi:hypothetical protein